LIDTNGNKLTDRCITADDDNRGTMNQEESKSVWMSEDWMTTKAGPKIMTMQK